MTASAQKTLRRPTPKHVLFLSTTVSVLACSGCGKFFVGPQLTLISIGPPNPTVTVTDADLVSISITLTSATINPGQSQQFTATGLLQTGNTVDLTKAVTWSSSNTSVATIDGYGLAVGSSSVSSLSTTDITAKSGNIKSNVATLTVQ